MNEMKHFSRWIAVACFALLAAAVVPVNVAQASSGASNAQATAKTSDARPAVSCTQHYIYCCYPTGYCYKR